MRSTSHVAAEQGHPLGELIATESRGTLMGNRGCLHDDRRRIGRAFTSTRWIICVLEFRGRHRAIMSPGRYTELFFLDEATALAAGHRPCAECQRGRYRLFRRLWAEANPDPSTSVSVPVEELDRILHAERLDDDRRKRTYIAPVSALPPGVMRVLTPKSIVRHSERLPRHAPSFGRQRCMLTFTGSQ